MKKLSLIVMSLFLVTLASAETKKATPKKIVQECTVNCWYVPASDKDDSRVGALQQRFFYKSKAGAIGDIKDAQKICIMNKNAIKGFVLLNKPNAKEPILDGVALSFLQAGIRLDAHSEAEIRSTHADLACWAKK